MKHKKLIGNFSFSICLFLTSVWAFWGIIENFHEGWYFDSFWKNIGLMFIQYLSPVLIFMMLSLISILKNKIGALLFLTVGIALALIANRFNYFVILPFFVLAVLIRLSEYTNKKLKYKLITFIPLSILFVFAIEPAYRISQRYNDNYFGTRTISQNGVSLVWAPRGPGWPDKGVSWYEAQKTCTYLTDDGTSLAETPQNIWRLPTIDEAVRSMQRHGKNCMGKLNDKGQAEYKIKPDKETPLWNPHSQIIYWWTNSETDSLHAYIIVYNGKIWKRNKNFSPDYLGFRAVKEIDTLK